MSEQPLYTLGPDDEVNALMVYTHEQVVWGESVSKKTIRFLKLLRTPMCPAYIVLYNAKVLPMRGSKPLAFPVVHVPISQVLVVHPTPPEQEAYDFDPKEQNRKFEAVTLLVGDFRMDGRMRMSTRTNLTQVLDVAKEPYLAVYDVSITSLSSPQRKPLHTRMAVARRTDVVFAAYSTQLDDAL